MSEIGSKGRLTLSLSLLQMVSLNVTVTDYCYWLLISMGDLLSYQNGTELYQYGINPYQFGSKSYHFGMDSYQGLSGIFWNLKLKLWLKIKFY